MKRDESVEEFDKYLDELEKGIFEVQKTNEKKTALESFNVVANAVNNIVQSSSQLLGNAQGIFALQAEITKINSETAIKLAEMQKSFNQFMINEENKKDMMIRILETLKEQNNKILDKAMAIDLSKCTEQEYAYVMSTLDKTEKFTDRIMDIFDRFITTR